MTRKSKYSPEFKEQAVKRTLTGSFTIKEVSESLDISYYILREWRKDYMDRHENNLPKTDKQLKEDEELRKLRKEDIKLMRLCHIHKANRIPSKWSKIIFGDRDANSNNLF